jgi:exoribonuclease-2
MMDNGFEPEFSDAIESQLKQIENGPEPKVDASIKDLRDLLWSSIDNESSRDLDQIEWTERLPNGDIRVLVGIADVDVRVQKDSPIDQHAAKNTVTVYTQSAIFPMLPEELSTGITSLNENGDRLAVVADMIVKENGDVPESTFYRALVRNKAKLSYEDLGDWLDNRGEMPAKIANNQDLKAQIELQKEAAERLLVFREAKELSIRIYRIRSRVETAR